MTETIGIKSRLAAYPRPLTISVTSGKGGVGKSVIALSLAAELASGEVRTLLVDADLGLGNQHLLLNQSPIFTFEDVLTASCRLDEAVLGISDNLSLLPARSGFADTDFAVDISIPGLRSQLSWAGDNFDIVIFDSGAGISERVMTLSKLTDIILIVTTPEIAAVADSYAVAKFQIGTDRSSRIGLVVNRAAGTRQGIRTAQNLQAMMSRFLGYDLPDVAIVKEHRPLQSIILSSNALTRGEDETWTRSIGEVLRIVDQLLPENLSSWTNGPSGEFESLSLLNLGKKNDDTLNMAAEVGEGSSSMQSELPTSRKDSL